jgi:hypothetical protein
MYAAARVLPSYRFDECTEDLGEVFSVVSEDAVPVAEISMSIQLQAYLLGRSSTHASQ